MLIINFYDKVKIAKISIQEKFRIQISLQDKVALVTSATAGIGFAIARGLAEAGAHVVITGRNPEKVEQAVINTVKNGCTECTSNWFGV